MPLPICIKPVAFAAPTVLLSGVRSVRDVHVAALGDDLDDAVASALRRYAEDNVDAITLIVTPDLRLMEAMQSSVDVLRALYPMAHLDDVLGRICTFSSIRIASASPSETRMLALMCRDVDVEASRAFTLADHMRKTYGLLPGNLFAVPFICQAAQRQPTSTIAGWLMLYMVAMCERLQTHTPREPPVQPSVRTLQRQKTVAAAALAVTDEDEEPAHSVSSRSSTTPTPSLLSDDAAASILSSVRISCEQSDTDSFSMSSPATSMRSRYSDRSPSPPPLPPSPTTNYLVFGMADPSQMNETAMTCCLLPALLTTVYCTCYLLPHITVDLPHRIEYAVDPLQWFYTHIVGSSDASVDVSLTTWCSYAGIDASTGGTIHTLRSLIMSLVLVDQEHTLTITAARMLQTQLVEATRTMENYERWLPLIEWLDCTLQSGPDDNDDNTASSGLNVPNDVSALIYVCLLQDISVVTDHATVMIILCGLSVDTHTQQYQERLCAPYAPKRCRLKQAVPVERAYFESDVVHVLPRFEVVAERYTGPKQDPQTVCEPASKRPRYTDKCTPDTTCAEFPDCKCLEQSILDRSRPVPEIAGILAAVLTGYEELANAHANSILLQQPIRGAKELPLAARVLAGYLQSTDSDNYNLRLPAVMTWNTSYTSANSGRAARNKTDIPVAYAASFPVHVP